MKHIRWGDNDHYFGLFTYAKDKKDRRSIAFVLGSGDEDYPGCRLRLQGLGHTLICALPPILRPWKKKVIAHTWDAATVERIARDWYFDVHEREYGFSYSGCGGIGDGGFLQLLLGRQTNDSSTEQCWGCFTPWNNWRHVRHSFYNGAGDLFWTEPQIKIDFTTKEGNDKYAHHRSLIDLCPTKTFSFNDFDGEALTAKTRIEERQWELGTGWFKWLSRFKKPIIQRSLDIEFSGETGKRKGSWKGGTVGHSIEMLPGELHQAAFKRYCAEHEMEFRGRSATINA